MEIIMLRNSVAIKILRIIAFVALMLGTSCISAGSVLKVDSSGSPIQVNETVTVPIKIENISDLTALEIHLSFDAAILEVVEMKDGSFIKADFAVQNTFDNTAGTIDYAVAQINREPVNGSGILLEIIFRAKASGNSIINFRETPAVPSGAIMSDSTGMALQVSLINGNVKVDAP